MKLQEKSTEHVINWDFFRIVYLLFRGWGLDETFQSKQQMIVIHFLIYKANVCDCISIM